MHGPQDVGRHEPVSGDSSCSPHLGKEVADVDELPVVWHPITWSETARDYEQRLLAHFGDLHDGRHPFANLTG